MIGTVVGIEAKVSQDGKKQWQNIVVEDNIGMVHRIGNWGKALAEDNIKGEMFKVLYSERGDYKNLQGLVPHTPTKQTEITETKTPTVDKPTASMPKLSLMSSARYLAMKLAVELVKSESIEIDKKEARLFKYYERILGELEPSPSAT